MLLPKCFIIETLFEVLKSSRGLEHTRHRSPVNALVYSLLSGHLHPGTTQGQHRQHPHPYPPPCPPSLPHPDLIHN